MKIKEVIPCLQKNATVKMKDGYTITGFISNSVSSLESESGKDEIEIMMETTYDSLIVEDIIAIRIHKD